MAAKKKGARIGPNVQAQLEEVVSAPAKNTTVTASTRKRRGKAPVSKTKKKANASAIANLVSKAIDKDTKGELKAQKLNTSPLPVVSSGSLALNEMIGGAPAPDGKGPICFGYPRRYITEVYGPEASGKTTLALEAIAECHRNGGIAMFLDFEHALHHGYAQKVGVDFDPDIFLNYQPASLEQGLSAMMIGIKAGVDLIVVDSVAAMIPEVDAGKKFTDADKIGAKAAKLSSLLPRIVAQLQKPNKNNPEGTAVIFINQTRAAIGTTGGKGPSGPSTTGGNALKFYCYLRLSANRIGFETIERVNPITNKKEKIPYGNKTVVKIVKSKVDAKQGRSCQFLIRFGVGIDDYLSTITMGVDHKIIKKGGAIYSYGDHKFQGREKFRKFLLANDDVFEELQAEVMRAVRSQDVIDDEETLAESQDELLESNMGLDEEPGDEDETIEDDDVEIVTEDDVGPANSDDDGDDDGGGGDDEDD